MTKPNFPPIWHPILTLLSGVLLFLYFVSMTLTARVAEPAAFVPLGPPAIYYGELHPGPGFSPTADMQVTAQIGDVFCGQTTTQDVDGQIVYVIDVFGWGPGGREGCGNGGQIITFQVDAVPLAPVITWDNNQWNQLDLSSMQVPSTPPRLTLGRSGNNLDFSLPEIVPDLDGNDTLILHYEIWRGTKPYFDPDDPHCSCTQIGTPSPPSFTDPNVFNQTDTNYFYAIRAVNAVGAASSMVHLGKFDFKITPGN